MRTLLRKLGPRYGISLGVLLLVGAVLVIGRLAGHPSGSLVTSGNPASLPTATGPSDDGSVALPSPVSPVTSPGAATPQQVTTDFVDAWLHTSLPAAQWRAAVTAHATARLAAEFADADPETVPATRVTGAFAFTDHTSTWVEVAIPMDSGTLTLSLLAHDGAWAVDTVDWSPS
jgi:hypothetical protein